MTPSNISLAPTHFGYSCMCKFTLIHTHASQMHCVANIMFTFFSKPTVNKILIPQEDNCFI